MQRIIFHIDGDAFFASCEQATKLSLRGRPIAVGRERGVATAFSYEAKALGVERGMNNRELRARFPEVTLIASDYRKYKLFSRRMHAIVARHTQTVEQTSIDECYADMSREVASWEEAKTQALALQDEIQTKLGLTVSIGIAPNKTIAKIASALHKPSGVSLLSPDKLGACLHPLEISRVSGVGKSTLPRMHALGIYTIGDFATQSAVWVREHFSKPYSVIHREIRGEWANELVTEQELPQSISKIRAFAPATSNRDILYAELVRNAEIVASKIYVQQLQAKQLSFFLKTIDGEVHTKRLRPPRAMASLNDILAYLGKIFHEFYQEGVEYRATSVEVSGLAQTGSQALLFGQDHVEHDNNKAVGELENSINRSLGKATITRASSVNAYHVHKTDDSAKEEIERGVCEGTKLLGSRDGRRVLSILYLGSI